MHKLPYLKKNRYSVYYFRLIFTQSVRSIPNAPKEISLSLGTKNIEIAIDRYMILFPYARALRWSLHELILEGNIDVSVIDLKLKLWKDKHRLQKIMADKDDVILEARKSLLHANNNNQELRAHASQIKKQNQQLIGALKTTKEIIQSKESSTTSVTISDTDAINDEKTSIGLPSESKLESTITTVDSVKTKEPSTAHKSTSQTILEYVELFIAYEAKTSTNANPGESRRNYLMRFLDIVGYDVALTSLNADHIRHYREMLHNLPANFEKQGFNIPRNLTKRPKWFKETIANWEGKTLAGGIESHFKHIRMFLTWAHNEHHLKDNFVPMLKMSAKLKTETKTITLNFMPKDLHKLFIDGHLYNDRRPLSKYDSAWKFWVPLIAMYTGMRSEEIGILSLKHFIQKEGFWCLRIPNKAKTDAGIRTFPIPQRLLDIGILDYRQQIINETSGNNEARIFPELKRKGVSYSNKIGQFFNRNKHGTRKDGKDIYVGYLHRCGIPNPSEKETLKFHSFRHGFITLMHETKLPGTDERLSLDLLKNLVGHKGDFKKYGISAETWDDVTKMTYNHHERVSLMAIRERFTLMKQAMDAMDFEVDLSGISYERFLARV